MKIIIATSDLMSYLVNPFCELWEKYGGPKPITILYYEKKPINLPDWVETISLGKQDRFWPNSISKYIKTIKENEFALFLEDNFLNTNFHINTFNVCKELIKECDKVCLYSNILSAKLKYVKTINDIFCFDIVDEKIRYYITSLAPAIWKKDTFLKFCHEGQTIWNFETCDQNKNSRIKVMATNPTTIICQNFFAKGKINKKAINRFMEEDIEILKKHNVKLT